MTESTTTSRRPRGVAFESSTTAELPITRPFERLVERLGPNAVFGAPIRTGDTTVIPVAEVRTGFGFGSGHDADEKGDGGGGGAGMRVTPRGYIVITEEDVRYRPIRGRFGPLALAGFALAAGFLISIASACRP